MKNIDNELDFQRAKIQHKQKFLGTLHGAPKLYIYVDFSLLTEGVQSTAVHFLTKYLEDLN